MSHTEPSPTPPAAPPHRPVPTEFLTCEAPFSSLDFGCAYLSTDTKSWCEARRACGALDADLAVPTAADYSLLKTYLSNNIAGESKYICHIVLTDREIVPCMFSTVESVLRAPREDAEKV